MTVFRVEFCAAVIASVGKETCARNPAIPGRSFFFFISFVAAILLRMMFGRSLIILHAENKSDPKPQLIPFPFCFDFISFVPFSLFTFAIFISLRFITFLSILSPLVNQRVHIQGWSQQQSHLPGISEDVCEMHRTDFRAVFLLRKLFCNVHCQDVSFLLQ